MLIFYLQASTNLWYTVQVLTLPYNFYLQFPTLDAEDFEAPERFETFDDFHDDVSHHHHHDVHDHGHDQYILDDFAASDHLPPTRPPRPVRPIRHEFSRPPHPPPVTKDPFHDIKSFGFNDLGPGHGPPHFAGHDTRQISNPSMKSKMIVFRI